MLEPDACAAQNQTDAIHHDLARMTYVLVIMPGYNAERLSSQCLAGQYCKGRPDEQQFGVRKEVALALALSAADQALLLASAHARDDAALRAWLRQHCFLQMVAPCPLRQALGASHQRHRYVHLPA